MINPFKDVDRQYKRKVVYTLVTIVLAAVAVYILYNLIPWASRFTKIMMAVLNPLLLGAVLCYLLYPAVTFFDKKLKGRSTKRKCARPLAVLIVLLIVAAAIGGLLTILIWTATRQITSIDYDSIVALITQYQDSAYQLVMSIQEFMKEQNIALPSLSGGASSITGNLSSIVTGILTGAAGAATSIFFGLIFAIYFLIDGANISRYWKNAAKAIWKPKTIALLKELASEADRCFSGYIRGQAIDGLIIGSVTSIVFLFIGMPYAGIIGLVTGVGNLIPYLGPILGYGSIIIINLLNFNPKMMVVGLITLAIMMFVDGNFINPRLLAGTVHVHPLLVVAALLAGGSIGGLLGMLLAVPTGAFLKLQFDKIIELRKHAA